MSEDNVVDDAVEETEVQDEELETVDTEESIDEEVSEAEPEVEVEEEVEEEEVPEESKSFSDAFKQHPELRKAYFEHRQFTEIFPSPEDAKEAYARAEDFRKFEDSVASGNVDTVIQAVIDSNPKAFETFAGDFLQNLRGMDEKLYRKAIAPELSRLLREVAVTAKKNGNKSLFLATQHVSDFWFDEAIPPEFPERQRQPQQDEQRNQDFTARKQDFFSELGTEIDSFLGTEISRNLDPKNVLPAMLKKSLTDDILQTALNKLKADKSAQNAFRILNINAARNGFRYEDRKKIRDTYAQRIRPIIQQIKGPKLAEALKSIGKKVVAPQKKQIPNIPSGSSVRKPVDPKKVDWTQTTSRMALDGNYVMKKQDVKHPNSRSNRVPAAD